MPDGFSGKITGNTSRFKRSSPMEAVSHHEKRSVILKSFYFYLLSQRLYLWRRLCNCNTDEKTFVDQYHWIDEEEMLDLVAIAQSCPGAIAVNGAIVVGYKLAGLPGVMTSVLATVIPPLPSFL